MSAALPCALRQLHDHDFRIEAERVAVPLGDAPHVGWLRLAA